MEGAKSSQIKAECPLSVLLVEKDAITDIDTSQKAEDT